MWLDQISSALIIDMNEIERKADYYKDFHHKCVTWYITIIGFFVAGVIAAPAPTVPVVGKVFGAVLVATSIACGALFFSCIAHYGARIKYLNDLLDAPETPVPNDWRLKHKSVGWEIHGIGSAFFFAILIGMQIVLLSLVVLRYWM